MPVDRRMTRELWRALPEMQTNDLRRDYLDRFWIPRPLFDVWLTKHHLPASPARFEPVSEPVTDVKKGREDGAIRYLAGELRADPKMTKEQARQLCRPFGITGRPFERVWRRARELAHLPPGRGGRPKGSKSKR
jgi:hypothetical protein